MRRTLILSTCLAGCVGTSAPNETGDDRPGQGDPRAAWGSEDLPEPGCVPDGDGILSADELVVDLAADVSVAFQVNPPGTTREVSVSDWDLDTAAEGDEQIRLAPSALGGAWFAADFPAAHHYAVLDRSQGILGIHRQDDDGLHLLGLASELRGDTSLTYSPSVPLLPTPLRDGDRWAVEAVAEGTADGVEYPIDWGLGSVITLHHAWSFEVDGSDTLALPAVQVHAQRVRVEVVTEARNAFGIPVETESRRVVLWVAECLGVVARARSLPNEPDEDFTEATELLRLALPEVSR